MKSLIIISIFNWRSGQPHALIHCPHWMVLVWFWSSITGRGNVQKVTDCMWPLCLCPRNILNIFFSFKQMLIRLKCVGDVKYTCKIAHCDPVNVRHVCSLVTLVFDMHFTFSIRTIFVLVWVEISVLWARLLPNEWRKHWIAALSLVYKIKCDKQQYMIWS